MAQGPIAGPSEAYRIDPLRESGASERACREARVGTAIETMLSEVRYAGEFWGGTPAPQSSPYRRSRCVGMNAVIFSLVDDILLKVERLSGTGTDRTMVRKAVAGDTERRTIWIGQGEAAPGG
jgi:hypothetical protein